MTEQKGLRFDVESKEDSQEEELADDSKGGIFSFVRCWVRKGEEELRKERELQRK